MLLIERPLRYWIIRFIRHWFMPVGKKEIIEEMTKVSSEGLAKALNRKEKEESDAEWIGWRRGLWR